MIGRVARWYNLLLALAFGIPMVFFFSTFHDVYAPAAARSAESHPALVAMINYPLQCQGGIILAFGIASLLQEPGLRLGAGRRPLEHSTDLAVLSLVATGLSFKSDYELWSSLGATSIPAQEYMGFVYFQLSADGLATLVAALTLLRAIDFRFIKWLIVLMQGTFGFLLTFFTDFMMGASFGPDSAPHTVAALAPGMEVVASAWRLCGSAMMGMALVMLLRSPYPAYVLVYALSSYAHVLAYLYTPLPGHITGAYPRMSLVTAFVLGLGCVVNALASMERKVSNKTTRKTR